MKDSSNSKLLPLVSPTRSHSFRSNKQLPATSNTLCKLHCTLNKLNCSGNFVFYIIFRFSVAILHFIVVFFLYFISLLSTYVERYEHIHYAHCLLQFSFITNTFNCFIFLFFSFLFRFSIVFSLCTCAL